MAIVIRFFFFLLCLIWKSEGVRLKGYKGDSQELFPNGTGVSRSDFPSSFVFGSLTLAIKHEGASQADGKSLNIWDVYANFNGTTKDGAIPETSGNSYYRYKDDIGYMVDMGVDAYRFSIAWSRLYPNNSNEVNTLAIHHYNKIINATIEAGLEPHVTLWVQDHPQWIEDSYGGPLNRTFIDDFVKYADTCFKQFGDRVKYWITFDEPNDYVALAYTSTECPPGRCSSCAGGNSGIEPYIVTHNILLAHGYATKIYKERYQEKQNGYIGISIWFVWNEPLNNNTADFDAAQRATDFAVGWYLDPLMFGEYPTSMRKIVANRLPTFTEEESIILKGSLDFIGLNMITAMYTTNNMDDYNSTHGYIEDKMVTQMGTKDGVAIGWGAHDYAVPWAMEEAINYIKTKYENPRIWITETGWGLEKIGLNATLDDDERIEYYETYLNSIKNAIGNGADVHGVFAWSLLDGFECPIGTYFQFGFYYVDSNLERFPRKSALWFKTVLTTDGENTSISYHRALLG